jgi:glycosyltransferase involved in cell wall biosynthesis
LRSRCPNVTFVDYCHAEQEYWKNGGYPRCAAAYQELLDLNITGSQHVKEWMVARGAKPDQIEVCYTNIDTERWQPDPLARQRTRARLGLSDDMTLIIFVGRLTAEKRPRLIPPIVQRLEHPAAGRFLCLVVGDGPERETIEQQTHSMRLDAHLRLSGRLSDADLRDTMAAADILLLPSESEGIAVAIFEAMAMGLVPVSVRAGGQAELVTPECGVLISHGPNELAEYASSLLRLIEDRELCQTMGAAARERVARYFPLSALGPRMAALLAQAEANRKSAPRPSVGYGLGHECAVQVVEQIRLERLLDELWVERESWRAHPRPHPTLGAPVPPTGWRRRVARLLRIKTMRLVQWGADHGLEWLPLLHEQAMSWARRHGW